jgi:hypothetical protein
LMSRDLVTGSGQMSEFLLRSLMPSGSESGNASGTILMLAQPSRKPVRKH